MGASTSSEVAAEVLTVSGDRLDHHARSLVSPEFECCPSMRSCSTRMRMRGVATEFGIGRSTLALSTSVDSTYITIHGLKERVMKSAVVFLQRQR